MVNGEAPDAGIIEPAMSDAPGDEEVQIPPERAPRARGGGAGAEARPVPDVEDSSRSLGPRQPVADDGLRVRASPTLRDPRCAIDAPGRRGRAPGLLKEAVVDIVLTLEEEPGAPVAAPGHQAE